jgi:hypothetical protein
MIARLTMHWAAIRKFIWILFPSIRRVTTELSLFQECSSSDNAIPNLVMDSNSNHIKIDVGL